jgi:hypothetical protein
MHLKSPASASGKLDDRSNTSKILLRSTTFWGTIREHSGNIQGTFREHSGNIQGTLREASGKLQGRLRQDSGKIQGRIREDSRKIQGRFGEHSHRVAEPTVRVTPSGYTRDSISTLTSKMCGTE